MNKRNFNLLISRIKTLEYKPADYLSQPSKRFFYMSKYSYNCGAPACMAGHGKDLFKTALTEGRSYGEVTAEALGIDTTWAREHLFNPNFNEMSSKERHKSNPIYLGNVTPAEAVTALTRVKLAGKNYQKLTMDDIWGGLRD